MYLAYITFFLLRLENENEKEKENENEIEIVVLLSRISQTVLRQLWDCIYHVLIPTSLISHNEKPSYKIFNI